MRNEDSVESGARVRAHGLAKGLTGRALCVLLIAFGFCCVRGANTVSAPQVALAQAPLAAASSANARSVLAWVTSDSESVASLRRGQSVLDVVSPATHRVRVEKERAQLVSWREADARLDAELSSAVDATAAAKMPLVACTRGCGPALSRAVLEQSDTRQRHVEELAALARTRGYQGLLVDYEELSCAPAVFSSFVEALAHALHGESRKLGVAVPDPCGRGAECGRKRSAYDLAALARVADLLVVMEYDYAMSGDEPVAPADWLRRGLRKIRAEVTRDDLHKVVVGLPLYGRVSRYLVQENGVLWRHVQRGRVGRLEFSIEEDRYDPAALSHVARIRMASGQHGRMYYETHRSLSARLQVVVDEGFSQVALWRLGGEDPEVWEVLRAFKLAAAR